MHFRHRQTDRRTDRRTLASYSISAKDVHITSRSKNCPQLIIEVTPTMFRTETSLGLTLTMTLTSDVDLQFRESYGYDPYISKKSRSEVIRFKS